MQLLNIVLLSLVGTSVAAPLSNRATTADKAVSSTAPKSGGKPAGSSSNSGSSNTGSTGGGSTSSTGSSNSGTSSNSASTSNTGSSTNGNSNTGNSNNPSSGSTGGGGSVRYVQGNANAAMVMYAAGAFANDAMTVSASLNTLGTETDTEKIRQLATVAFQAESDEDQRRNVLATAAGSAGANSNSLIVKNTPAVLDGLQKIQNDPTPQTAKAALPAIEKARNPNILPSITQLSQSALDNAGVTSMSAVTFAQTVGSSGSTGGNNGNNNSNTGKSTGSNNSGNNNSGNRSNDSGTDN